MWGPWHWDQAAQDEADERAARAQDDEDEANLLALLEAHAEHGRAAEQGA